MATIDSKIPEGIVSQKWTNYKAHQKLVNPANKRKLDIIVVGTGLAGASAAASLGEMGFKLRAVSMQLRTTKTTATLYIVFSMIR